MHESRFPPPVKTGYAYLLSLLLLTASSGAIADCASALPLHGSLSIKDCDSNTQTCSPASDVVYSYTGRVKDEQEVLTIATHASPWRFYDSEMRILSAEEVAKMIRSKIGGKVKRILLIASWTGVAPEAGGKSLAEKLSEALDGFPVTGMDGFLWIDEEGSLRTTHQAFTLTRGRGPYYVAKGDEVMVSLAAGWTALLEDFFVKERDADGVMRAGAGWDIFFLCPDRALQAFEAAAKLSSPIAAYNAAVMRIDRDDEGDIEAAKILLTQAAEAGDKKSRVRLKKLK